MRAAFCVAVMAAVSSDTPLPKDRAELALSLAVTSARARYVIGEPVVLRCALRNLAPHPIEEYRVDNSRDHGNVEVHVSRDGFRFSQYRMGIFPTERVSRKKQTLGASADWSFELRVLYTFERASRLAFEQPGEYSIKVLYPLISRSTPRRQVVESNVVRVEVHSPTGADAVVWSVIRELDFVYFLQSGLVNRDHPDVPRRAVELLRTAAGSRYESSLRWALEQYYNDRRSRLSREKQEKDEVLNSIRGALHMPTVAAAPFPEDGRLDVKITYHFPEWTSLEKALGVISAKSGVELAIAPELAKGKIQTLEVVETLREFMGRQAVRSAIWLKEGDVYKLAPKKE